MFEVEVLNLINGNRFTKVFNDSIKAWKYIQKVKYSKKLDLVCVRDFSYLFD